MTFGAPGYLVLIALAGVAAIAVGLWLSWRGAVRGALPSLPPPTMLLLPAVLVVLGAAVAAFAAARPQAGQHEELTEDRGIDLVIVLDVSQSMYARDGEPDRIGRAQAEIAALLERMSGDRVGVVIFGGSAFARSPLTADLRALSDLVGGVDRERALVTPGSDLGLGIARAQELVRTGSSEAKALLIVSDGEDHRGELEATVRRAREDGLRIYAAAVGTTAGAPVVDIDPVTGASSERADESGEPVVTRRDDASMRAIAEIGGGVFVSLDGEGRPLSSLAAEFESLGGTTFATEDRATPIERFQLFAAVALGLVAAAIAARAVLAPGRIRGFARLWPAGAAALFIGAVCSTDVAELNRRGNAHYAASEYSVAVDVYRTAQAIDPERRELNYNAGNALDRQGDYTDAIEETRNALQGEDDELKALAEYALGNHHAAASQLNEAVEAYKRALLIDPEDEDAKHNLEVLLRRLAATPTPSPSPTPVTPEGTPTASDGDGDPGDTPASTTPNAGSGDDATPGGTPESPGTPGVNV